MISAERCSVHVWRLASDIAFRSMGGRARVLRQMVTDTEPGPDRETIRRLAEEANALLHSEPWRRGLRTMRALRWSSY